METEVFATLTASSPVHGATIVRHQNGQCLVSIGGDLSSVDDEIRAHYLQIRVMDIATAAWKSYAVATNGIFNRAYHAAVSLSDDIYVFGGENLAQKPSRYYTLPRQAEHEILKIQKGFFGYKATIITPSSHLKEEHLSLVGLSANVVGKVGHLQHILLFGGYHPSGKKFHQDITLFTVDIHGVSHIKAVEVDAVSSRPPARAFHSTAVIGSDNTHLIIFGGHNSDNPSGILDLWVLDMTEVLISLDPSLVPSPVIEPAPTGKGNKSTAKADKNAPKAPTAVWAQITLDLSPVLPRFKANMTVVPVADRSLEQYRLLVFGGCSDTGSGSNSTSHPLLQYHECMLSLTKDTVTGKQTVTASGAAISELKSFAANNNKLSGIMGYGASSALLFDSDYPAADSTAIESGGQPLGIVIFGGDRNPLGQGRDETLVTIFDPSSQAAKRLKKILRRGNKQGSQQDKSKSQPNSHGKVKRLHYENGDEYYGEVYDTRKPPAAVSSPSVSGSRGVSASATRILPSQLSTSLYDHSTVDDGRDEEGEEEEESEEGIVGAHIPHGHGTMTYATSTDQYIGSWYMGQRQGSETTNQLAKDNGGWIYEGCFHHDLPHGSGHSHSTTTSQSHSGEYKDGLYHGQGILHDENGNTYTGIFQNGLKHGHGILTNDATNMRCEGTWANDHMIGTGTAVNLPIKSFNLSRGYAPEETPLSQYENALLNQSSSWSFSSTVMTLKASIITLKQFHSGRYTGPLYNGKPQGEVGTCLYEDASVYQGCWKNGRRNGLGTYSLASNNSKYEGKFVGDKRSGNGRMTGVHGLEYDGLWQDNAPNGMGLLFDYEAGTVYEGEFKAGLQEGTGVLRDLKHGRVLVDGLWVHGHPMLPAGGGSEGQGQQFSPSPVSVAVIGGTTLGKK